MNSGGVRTRGKRKENERRGLHFKHSENVLLWCRRGHGEKKTVPVKPEAFYPSYNRALKRGFRGGE